MATLYQISEEISLLAETIDHADGELTPEVEARLDGIMRARDEKLDNYVRAIREMSARAEARRHEAKMLADAAAAEEATSRRLKAVMLAFLQKHNMRVVQTANWSIRRRGNGGETPMVIDRQPTERDVADMPNLAVAETYYKWKSSELRAALEQGEQLEFARLATRGEHLRIE